MAFDINLFTNIIREEFNLFEKARTSDEYDKMLNTISKRCEEYLSTLVKNYRVKFFGKPALTYDLVMLGSEKNINELTVEKFLEVFDVMVMLASEKTALIMIESIPKSNDDEINIKILDTTNPNEVAEAVKTIISL